MSFPLKEGLRHQQCENAHILYTVEMSFPLKEGLRQHSCYFCKRIIRCRNVFSIKRRIATCIVLFVIGLIDM